MTVQNRKALKEFFKDGALPTGSNFADMVDSSLNLRDDGFSRTVQNGVEIALVGAQKRLLSFFVDEAQGVSPDWCITCDPQDSRLSFVRAETDDATAQPSTSNGSVAPINGGVGADGEVLTLYQDGQVGVNGTIRSSARFGRSATVPADGQWHDITEVLSGCQILEVVAGVGLPGEYKGRYALLHAIAMNTFHPRRFFFDLFFNKRPIDCRHAWYMDCTDRIKLRWAAQNKMADKHTYTLQLKSMRAWEKDARITYSITRLWLDSMTTGA